MSGYTPNYPDTTKVSNGMTATGFTSRECVEIEEAVQKKVADSPEWLLAKKVNSVSGKMMHHHDSSLELEALGFKMLGEYDELFYRVQPPEGWIKTTHGYWTKIVDENGIGIISQFHKGAFYDHDAFLNIEGQGAGTPHTGAQEPPDDPRIFNREQKDGTYRPISEFFEPPDEEVEQEVSV